LHGVSGGDCVAEKEGDDRPGEGPDVGSVGGGVIRCDGAGEELRGGEHPGGVVFAAAVVECVLGRGLVEVGQFEAQLVGTVAFDEDVLGVDVEMDHALLVVQVGQGEEDLVRHLQEGGADVLRGGAEEVRVGPEVAALAELGDEEGVGGAQVVVADDVRVGDLAEEFEVGVLSDVGGDFEAGGGVWGGERRGIRGEWPDELAGVDVGGGEAHGEGDGGGVVGPVDDVLWSHSYKVASGVLAAATPG